MGESGQADGTQAAPAHRVLVVDDSEALAAAVAESLEHVDGGLRTAYTTEPAAAVSRLREGRFDCLVTDYEMGDTDGLALVDRDTTDTPFVVFTQRRDERLRTAVADRGGAYLQKGAGREQFRRLATLVRGQLPD
ncbi:response regulator [Haloarcula laminariae]|uniref:response regulator n=1 Tax=Haloarcula laminariae TaxID=2961577 RepID=UPI0021CA4989|nr:MULTISPECIES: response regulator [Halomicroarcula]